jgi:hypothetical protein
MNLEYRLLERFYVSNCNASRFRTDDLLSMVLDRLRISGNACLQRRSLRLLQVRTYRLSGRSRASMPVQAVYSGDPNTQPANAIKLLLRAYFARPLVATGSTFTIREELLMRLIDRKAFPNGTPDLNQSSVSLTRMWRCIVGTLVWRKSGQYMRTIRFGPTPNCAVPTSNRTRILPG